MRTFDLDAFDAYDPRDRPGEHILPWEMWERDRPWRADTPDSLALPPVTPPPVGQAPAAADGLPGEPPPD